jgi:hypothetical protein
MISRLPAVRTLTVRRGYEFARLQQQLLSLAYEHLLPIVRPQPGSAAAASRPTRPAATSAAAP